MQIENESFRKICEILDLAYRKYLLLMQRYTTLLLLCYLNSNKKSLPFLTYSKKSSTETETEFEMK